MFEVRLYGEMLGNYVQAGNQSCPPSMLKELALSDVDRIRRRVAENPNTPIEVLELLSTDKNADVRVAVGTNPSTPAHLSYALAFDEDPNVRLGLADDMNTPVELLDKLIADENPYVSVKAFETRALKLAKDKPRDFGCHRFFRWATGATEQPELKYA